MKTYSRILTAVLAVDFAAVVFYMATMSNLAPGSPPNNQPNVPHWTKADAKAFPGCSARKVLGDVVVVHNDSTRERMSFDEAWHITHDHNDANDVWVIGFCR